MSNRVRAALVLAWEGGGFGTRRERHGPIMEHDEGSLVLLLETCDRSLERLGATPEGRHRLLHHDVEIVRDRYAEELAALRDG
jgi:hypothetical protein